MTGFLGGIIPTHKDCACTVLMSKGYVSGIMGISCVKMGVGIICIWVGLGYLCVRMGHCIMCIWVG